MCVLCIVGLVTKVCTSARPRIHIIVIWYKMFLNINTQTIFLYIYTIIYDNIRLHVLIIGIQHKIYTNYTKYLSLAYFRVRVQSYPTSNIILSLVMKVSILVLHINNGSQYSHDFLGHAFVNVEDSTST